MLDERSRCRSEADKVVVACGRSKVGNGARTMVEHVIGKLGAVVLLRLVDFMTKKEAPRSTVGLRS